MLAERYVLIAQTRMVHFSELLTRRDHDTVISSAFRVIYILVLPKFQLDVKPPSYLAWDQSEIPVSICARYCINYYLDKLGLN